MKFYKTKQFIFNFAKIFLYMKQLFALVLLLTNFFLFSQNQTTKEIKKIKIEDSNGNLITDSIQIEQFLAKRNTGTSRADAPSTAIRCAPAPAPRRAGISLHLR